MSVDAKAKNESARIERKAFQRGLAEKRIKRQIARSFLRGVQPEIEGLLHTCVINEPARIKSVSFQKSAVKLEIFWPFMLPEPTGNPDDWVGTRSDVGHFREEFMLYLLEQRQAAKLANLFHSEFLLFIKRFFGAAKYESYPIGKETGKTVGEYLELLGTVARHRRLAGPTKVVIPPRRATQMRFEGCEIIKVLQEMRKTYSRPTDEITKRTEDNLFWQLESHYDSDYYSWMKYFRRSFRLLEPTKTWKERRPLLAASASWSAKALAIQILRQKYLHETGADYPVGAISNVMKCGTGSHR